MTEKNIYIKQHSINHLSNKNNSSVKSVKDESSIHAESPLQCLGLFSLEFSSAFFSLLFVMNPDSSLFLLCVCVCFQPFIRNKSPGPVVLDMSFFFFSFRFVYLFISPHFFPAFPLTAWHSEEPSVWLMDVLMWQPQPSGEIEPVDIFCVSLDGVLLWTGPSGTDSMWSATTFLSSLSVFYCSYWSCRGLAALLISLLT